MATPKKRNSISSRFLSGKSPAAGKRREHVDDVATAAGLGTETAAGSGRRVQIQSSDNAIFTESPYSANAGKNVGVAG